MANEWSECKNNDIIGRENGQDGDHRIDEEEEFATGCARFTDADLGTISEKAGHFKELADDDHRKKQNDNAKRIKTAETPETFQGVHGIDSSSCNYNDCPNKWTNEKGVKIISTSGIPANVDGRINNGEDKRCGDREEEDDEAEDNRE